MQKTLSQSVKIEGIGLHSGLPSTLVLNPAPANSGINFVRQDLQTGNVFPALYSHVIDTRNCTCLGNDDKQVVSTIEHIMATLYILGVDNVQIEINNPEVPIMDGSGKVFYDIMKNIPLQEQKSKRRYLKVKNEIIFADNKQNRIILSPSEQLEINFTIDFPSKIVGHQEFNEVINEKLFASEIAPARTFCEKYQVDYLRSVGLIKGGSLENAVVLDGETVLNDGGFRVENECVKHKVLDCIGDMYTSGYRLSARITAEKTGHYHNNEVLKILFADEKNYEIIEE